MHIARIWRPMIWAPALAAALVIGGLSVAPAQADTAPPVPNDPYNPQTVSVDALPTVQIDGVVWTQKVIGNTVYVGGDFDFARPAGAAPGVDQVARSNLLAYNITTGVLIDSWAPTTNGEVLTITSSPDNSRIYIGGNFTDVNGQTKNRIAALNPTTGAIIQQFAASSDATVRAIAATSSTVYLGGVTTAINGVTRSRVGAVNASDGSLLPFAPNAAGGNVFALAVSPDQSKVLVAGSFTTMNGSDNPGRGLAAVDPITGASLAWPANAQVRNGGSNTALNSLTSVGNSVYVTGYAFGSGGTLEGAAKMSWDGTLTWVEDCHGDTYVAYPIGGVVYTAAHSHYCGNVPGGFHETSPRTHYHALAWSDEPAATEKAEYFGGQYYNWVGTPTPAMLQWFPNQDIGTFTGQSQASWSIAGNSDYVVAGGEFPRVGANGGGWINQQGLVRYAKRSIAPNDMGPEFTGSKGNPRVTSPAVGKVLVTWETNFDRDNQNLTYKVMRNGNLTTPAYTVTAASRLYDRPYLSWIDNTPTVDLVAGQSVRYRIFAEDPLGNEVRSDTVNVTVAGSGPADVDDYGKAVLADGPMHFWRFNETSGTSVADYTGLDPLTTTSGVQRNTPGAIPGGVAATFPGNSTNTSYNTTARPSYHWESVEAWFKTTTSTGGKIIGYGDSQSGTSTSSRSDRTVYMQNSGAINFGVRQGTSYRVIASPGTYRDGQWHHVVGTIGDAGMQLFIDGQKVGSRNDTTAATPFTGYWRVGGDNLSNWPNRPNRDYFTGDIDDVAVYRSALTGAEVRNHFVASGRTVAGPAVPADAYGAEVHGDGPELYWRLAELSGTTADDSSQNGAAGGYINNPTLGAASAIGVGSDRSVTFDGNNDNVAANASVQGPKVYSEEVWFKTTSNSGGKLIGFGSARTGNSTTFDRHVFMTNAGKLRFGVIAGAETVIESPNAYNNGAWHHVVATQGTGGMKLYVDGQLVASNPQLNQGAYTGYWRLGGDNLASVASRPNSDYFAGQLDEAAVYDRALTASEVLSRFTKGGGSIPNDAPIAAFTSAVSSMQVTFDSSGSSDPDGTIASYSWNFGDGQSSTTANPSHGYATAGTYDVTLTVTDNLGKSSSVTHQVTVTNPAPTAAFDYSVSVRTVTFNSSGSSDPNGTIAGYLWNFGDAGTSTAANPQHLYAGPGTYNVTLTVTDNHGATSSITKPVVVSNAAPTAAFTSSVDMLAATFNSSGSSDSDGTIASYSWTFGDGGTSTAANPSHTYAAPGTYTVNLTVTDNDGATGNVSHQLTVANAANNPPTAAFTSSVAGLQASFNSSGSTDGDGTIVARSWTFGDGQNGTGTSPSHTYAAAGTYNVTLTVTDDDGASDDVTHQVTVVDPDAPVVVASDAFGRTVAGGLGSADVGGAWALNGTASLFNVNGGSAAISLNSAGAGPGARLPNVSAGDSDSTVRISLDKLANGGGAFLSIGSRLVNDDSYRAKAKIDATGRVTLYLVRVVGGTETTLTSVLLPVATTYAVGEQLQIRLQTEGSSPTTLRARAWEVGTTEPTTWQVTTTDGTAGLQGPGGVRLATYVSGSTTNVPGVARFDDLVVTTPGAGLPDNVAPTAAFTSATASLQANFDGTGSSDSDGTIASYAWTFGDGQNGTGASPSHTYATGGTYDVTLTVTDDGGATGSVTHQVTVSAPAGVIAADDFQRTVVGGFGAATTGGNWVLGGTASLFNVNNGSGAITMNAAGAGPRASLTSVSATDSDTTVKFSLDKIANGGGAFASVGSRVISNNSYRAKVKLDATGRVTIYLVRVDAAETTLASVLLPATTTYAVGEQLQVRLQTEGTSPTTLRARTWEVGTTEPTTWQVTATDNTASFQNPGGFTLVTYLTGSATNAPVLARFDDFLASSLP